MEIEQFIANEVNPTGNLQKRFSIYFCNNMKLSSVTIFEPSSTNFTDRSHLMSFFERKLSAQNLGFPDFRQVFCDKQGMIQYRCEVWDSSFMVDSLTCVKILKKTNISLLSYCNDEFYLQLS